jgi:FKBP-type peptidyl-prolyl cis-trans isomerase
MTRLCKKLLHLAAAVGLWTAMGAAAVSLAGPALAQGQAPFQTTPGGLQYRDLQTGSGPAAALGDVAEIHFAGWLDENGARGRQIYSSREQGRPVSFVVGTERVMEGWNQAVIGMRVGGRRLVMVPPELAFGDRAVDDVIPARAYLVMIIELIGLEKSAE